MPMLGDWTANGECVESEFPKPVTAADTDSLIFSGRERRPHRLHCLVNQCTAIGDPRDLSTDQSRSALDRD